MKEKSRYYFLNIFLLLHSW